MFKKEQRSIIEFDNVSWRDDSQLVSDISSFTVSLRSSDLALVKLTEEEPDSLPISDLAAGLLEPADGSVLFLGENWQSMTLGRQSDMRSKTGRVFAFSSWVSSLTVYDNIVLSERHNTCRSDSDIKAEVDELAHTLGMEFIPAGRPDAVRPSDLRKCELIRAFVGQPDLLLLESPEAGLSERAQICLNDLLKNALELGAAALWITQSERIFESLDFENTYKYVKNGDKIAIKGE